MKKLAEGYGKACNCVNRILGFLIVLLFAAMFGSCILQVVTRYVLNNSLVWTDELARYTFIWGNMLGAAYCTWTFGHATLTVCLDRFPAGVRRILQILTYLLVAAIGCVLVVAGIRLMPVVAVQKSPALHLPMRYVYSSVLVGGVLFVLYSIGHILNFLGGEPAAKEEV
ncbi:TRAP transporter small permease [Hominifimenecus sp. rT4P-3]|uniref:TRAP transporter small permease n=1 Tax=Hominifimenecus sp. rT4P-3 TaxID=3242979 RepID=UPI003DA65BC1